MTLRKYINIISLSAVVLAVAAIGTLKCGTATNHNNENIAARLLDLLNTRLPGFEVTFNPEQAQVVELKKNRYLVTLKNCVIKSDLTRLMQIIPKAFTVKKSPIHPTRMEDSNAPDSAHIEEMVIVYEPITQLVDLQSIKKMSIEITEPDVQTSTKSDQDNKDFQIKKVRASIGKIDYIPIDINESNHSGRNNIQIVDRGPVLTSSVPFRTEVSQLEVEISGTNTANDNISVLLKNDNITAEYKYMLQKEIRTSEVERMLEKNIEPLGVKVILSNNSVFITKNLEKWGSGNIETLQLTIALKPGKKGLIFNMITALDILKSRFTAPKNKTVQFATHLDHCRYSVSLENLSVQATTTFLNIITESVDLRDISIHDRNRALFYKVIKFFTEMIQSKGYLKISISPFKHFFGELSMEMKLRLKSFQSRDITTTLTLFNIDDILKKIKKSGILSPAQFNEVLDLQSKYTVKNENGDAVMNFKADGDDPGYYTLNGKREKISQETHQ